MPGIINSAMPSQNQKYGVLQTGAMGYDPEKRVVGVDETVAGQLDKLLAADSPVLQRARSSAAGVANSRGLLNSSMGVQAGEAAVIDAAVPIAGADAGVYNLAARENQAAGNTAFGFTADSSNRAALTNVGAANDLSSSLQKIQKQGEVETGLTAQRGQIETGLTAQKVQAEKDLAKQRGEIETGLQQLRGGQAKVLADIEANYKQLMQANSSAAAVFNEAMAQIATILRDPSTSAAQKSAATQGVTQLLQSNLAAAGAITNLDLLGLLDFSGGTPVLA